MNFYSCFGLISLFKVMLAFWGFFMSKPFLSKDCSSNLIALLHFELAYDKLAAEHVSFYNTKSHTHHYGLDWFRFVSFLMAYQALGVDVVFNQQIGDKKILAFLNV